MNTKEITASDVAKVVLPPEALPALRTSVAELAAEYGAADHPGLLHRLGELGHLLPSDLRTRLQGLRYLEAPAALVVRGCPVEDDPGQTPAHWKKRPLDGTVPYDIWLTLVAGQLGDPICWASLQDGRLLNDILPIAGEEEQQIGHGSGAELEFHVEDAFHDDRCDVLALLCLRNVDAVPTTVASVASLDLTALDLDVLLEPRFRILPTPNTSATSAPRRASRPGPAPVLYGQPYLRVDPAYTEPVPGDATAQEAFGALCRQLEERLVDVALDPGDLLLVDNHRAVHGRRRFRARYDGTDRWLRKVTSPATCAAPEAAGQPGPAAVRGVGATSHISNRLARSRQGQRACPHPRVSPRKVQRAWSSDTLARPVGGGTPMMLKKKRRR